jgi:hypothetical protein
MDMGMKKGKKERLNEQVVETLGVPGSNGSRFLTVIAVSLCLVGALRIFVFSAGFPLFTNVDEIHHFDLVYKYSKGEIPRQALPLFSPEAAEMFLLYGTPEYLPAKIHDGQIQPPPWRIPGVRESENYRRVFNGLVQSKQNGEGASFPAYYTVAGLWYDLGQRLGLADIHLAFWVRFLNMAIFGAMVWLCHLLAKMVMPGRFCLHVALLTLVAFVPQDLFYSITNDVPGAPLFALALLMLLHLYYEDRSMFYYLGAGLAVGICCLTKISNLAGEVLLAVMVILKIRRIIGQKAVKAHLIRLAVLAAAATVPPGLWLVRNYIVMGDLTAGVDKARWLGWTMKPLSQFLNHPILTADGAGHFFATLTKTAWRGEFVWLNKVVAFQWMDTFYVLLTATCVIASVAGFVLGKRSQRKEYRLMLILSFMTVGISVLLLVVLSMMFDFGYCVNPSRVSPYFVSARLVSCGLVPLLFICIDGLQWVCQIMFRGRASVLVVTVGIVVVMTWSEVMMSLPAFASQYNWFHSW